MTMKRILGAFFLVALTAVQLEGAQNPIGARGFNPDAVFQNGTIDDINTFSGSLVLTMPLGKTYTSGDRLQYSFSLFYTSSVWEYERRYRSDIGYRTETVPSRRSNAGVGFILTLGELFVSDTNIPVYIAPDGSEHAFNTPRLHFDSEAVTPGVFYTRDGGYIRLRTTDAGGEVLRTVDLPDGISKEFVCVAACSPQNQQTRYLLRRVYDAFGNRLTVEREAEPSGAPGQIWRWTIKEQLEGGLTTEHYLTFEYFRYAPYRWIVNELDLAVSPATFTVGQPAGPARRAKYSFEYYLNEVGQMYRPKANTAPASMMTVQPPTSSQKYLWVPMLKSVKLPDDSKWQFQYHHAAPTAPPHDNVDLDNLLQKVIYPTGGGIGYEWGTYKFPRRACFHPQERDPIPTQATSNGVVKRQLLLPSGEPDGEPWRYFQSGIWGGGTPPPGTTCLGFDSSLTTIVDPLGNVTLNYFTDVINQGAAGDPKDYGLPFSSSVVDPAGEGRKLSTKAYHCTSTQPFDPAFTPEIEINGHALNPATASECGSALRETYVRYESSGQTCDWADDDNGSVCHSANRRLASQRTVFKDDDNSWIQADYSDFDGLGHYRQTKTTGNLFEKNASEVTRLGQGPHPRGDKKISRTVFNPSVNFNASAQTFCCVRGPSEPWVLNTYNEITEEEPTSANGEAPAKGGIAKTHYLFDERGFLQQKRTLIGNQPQAHDLLTEYKRTDDTGGRVRIDERYFGGDLKTMSTGPLPLANPDTADYVIEKVYRFGSLEKTEYKTCSNISVLLVEKNEIDPYTGMILSTKDSTGATTTFQYDLLNRVIEQQPPGGESKTKFLYTAAVVDGTFAPASVVASRPAGAFDPETKWTFDPFGRVHVVSQRLPDLFGDDDRRSRAVTTYWPTGQIREQSAAGLEGVETPGNLGKTIFNVYDPFGRVLDKTHPDSTVDRVLKTTYEYRGARSVKTVVTGTATDGGTTTSKEYHDSQGRLAAVIENIGGAPQTIYEYDSSNRLVKVFADPQTRTYEYDNRGFLRKEVHPELGANGITYGGYDARGHVHEVYYGSQTSRELLDRSLQYDAAERLGQVKQPGRLVNGTAALLKSYTYHQGSDGAHQLGLLKQAQRYNYVYEQGATSIPRTITVVENYEYWPESRRLKTKTLTSAGSPGLRLITTFAYDSLGNLASTDYPRLTDGCDISWTCIPAGPPRTVQNNYQFGFLTGIPGFVNNIGYHPNGLVAWVKTQNNAEWIQDIATHNLPRPDRIRVTVGGAPRWNSGYYVYDGAGQIQRIDNDFFTYDEAGRLVKSAMSAPAGTQTFTYDPFGNHQPFPGSSVNVQSTSNRLPDSVAAYDVAGNVLSFTDPRQSQYVYKYEYDPYNMVRHLTGWNGDNKVMGRMFLYNADDERVATIDYVTAAPQVLETWSARGAGNVVIRDFKRLYNPNQEQPPGANAAAVGWNWDRDYVFRGSVLAATVDPTGTAYVHVDHLGSPRVTTDAAGTAGSLRIYKAFGEEAVSVPDPVRLKFTGHERDVAGGDRQFGDLDYMHARYYNPFLGRFLSIDPGRDVDLKNPQSWNLYTYVRNSPIGSTDPTGRATKGNMHEAGVTSTERCGGGSGGSNGCADMEAKRKEQKAKTDAEEERRKELAEVKKTGMSNGGLTPTGKADRTEEIYDTMQAAEDAEGFANQAMGFYSYLGIADLNPVSIAGLIMKGDEEYERKVALVDETSDNFKAGAVLGVLTDIFAAVHGNTPIFGTGKGGPSMPKPKIRGRYGDGTTLRWEPAPPN